MLLSGCLGFLNRMRILVGGDPRLGNFEPYFFIASVQSAVLSGYLKLTNRRCVAVDLHLGHAHVGDPSFKENLTIR